MVDVRIVRADGAMVRRMYDAACRMPLFVQVATRRLLGLAAPGIGL